jgi:MOSC domain-containing protein YiiM
VHGGPEKAVHLYPSTHYAKLAAKFAEVAPLLVPGSMGENIATAELDEHDVRLGDVWQLGTALIQVCQPRNPCCCNQVRSTTTTAWCCTRPQT